MSFVLKQGLPVVCPYFRLVPPFVVSDVGLPVLGVVPVSAWWAAYSAAVHWPLYFCWLLLREQKHNLAVMLSVSVALYVCFVACMRAVIACFSCFYGSCSSNLALCASGEK